MSDHTPKDGDVDFVHQHTINCTRACAGQDMSDVPKGAVERLVKAFRAVEWNSHGICNWCGRHKGLGHSSTCAVSKALAPFVKE